MAARSYFRHMKKLIAFFAGATLLAGLPLFSQDSTTSAAAVAAQQDAEERYKRLNAAVEELIAAQAAQQKKFAMLTEELKSLREEIVRNANNNTTRDELRTLAEKVAELDKLRQADKELILGEIKKLAKLPAAHPPKPAAETKLNTEPAAGPEKGYEYSIRDGDTLSSIVADYRKAGVKVTVAAILKANPKLKPEAMKIGQKIFIPQPTE